MLNSLDEIITLCRFRENGFRSKTATDIYATSLGAHEIRSLEAAAAVAWVQKEGGNRARVSAIK